MERPFLRIRLDLPDDTASVPLCRRAVGFVLRELSVEPERAADIELVISEATGNVVRHAYVHPGNGYRLTIEFFASRVRLVVEDAGTGIRPDPAAAVGEEREGGRGLWLMEQLADRFSISHRAGGGACVHAEFRLPRPVCLPRSPGTAPG